MHWHLLALLPPLNGADVPFQVDGDVFPGVQAIFGAGQGRLAHGYWSDPGVPDSSPDIRAAQMAALDRTDARAACCRLRMPWHRLNVDGVAASEEGS
jgi:hypothetical protein